MKLEIEIRDLVRVINLLDKISLKGMKSIHRTNLNCILQEKLQIIAENEKQLRNDWKDNPKKLQEELAVFFTDKIVVEGGDNQSMLASVKSVINEVIEKEEMEFSNDDAYAIAALYDGFK